MSEDMTTPVTRGELREELAAYPTRVELKAELEKLKTELGQEIARHMKAGFEEMRKLFGVLDDKSHAPNDQQASLSRRVDLLEVAVFDPPSSKP